MNKETPLPVLAVIAGNLFTPLELKEMDKTLYVQYREVERQYFSDKLKVVDDL
jgi:hypothetical protein